MNFRNIKKYFTAIFMLTLIISFSACENNSGESNNSSEIITTSKSVNNYGLTSNVEDGVMLHAYMWRFSDIKNSLNEIANAGYNSIQVSPVQRTKATGQWWLLYQPCNFGIGNSQLGSYSDFQSLCQTADSYGIKIIVDAVLNHVADNGSDGQWDNAIDDSLKRSDWYHNQGTCTNYSSRWNVTQQNLGNLPDLATQRSDVQNVIINFLNDCVNAGADGFRFDAAKHIETNQGEDHYQSWAGNFWDNVLGNLTNRNSLYLFGEVLPDGGDNDAVYLNYFDITAHSYIWTLNNAVSNHNLTGVGTITHQNHNLDPSKALAYVENHDTYEHSETSHISYWNRKMAHAIIVARAYLVPRLFDRSGETLWKDSDIVALNKFRNAMAGKGEYLRNPESDVLIVERGTAGMAIINVGGSTYIDSPTNLANGTYTNHASQSCTMTVSNGRITGNIPGGNVVVLYNGNNNNNNNNNEWPSAYFRGTANSWGAAAMTKVSANTWEITQTFGSGDGGGGPRFKITKDTTWNEAYPAQDFTVDANKTYKITFNDSTKDITVTEDNNNNNNNNNNNGNITLKMTKDTGSGSSIFFTGGCSALTNWGTGVEGTWTSGNVWELSIADPGNFQWKVRKGNTGGSGNQWESGGNHDQSNLHPSFNGGF